MRFFSFVLFFLLFDSTLQGCDRCVKELHCLQKSPRDIVEGIDQKDFVRAWRQFGMIQRTFWYRKEDMPQLKKIHGEIIMLGNKNWFDFFGHTLGDGAQRYVSLCCELYRSSENDIDGGELYELLLQQAELFHRSLCSSFVVAGKIELLEKNLK